MDAHFMNAMTQEQILEQVNRARSGDMQAFAALVAAGFAFAFALFALAQTRAIPCTGDILGQAVCATICRCARHQLDNITASHHIDSEWHGAEQC